MPRANRHFPPGLVWQFTDRCHQREVPFKFSRDRDTWLHEQVNRELTLKARYRQVDITNERHILREPDQSYSPDFNTENATLSVNNAVLWHTNFDTSEA
jgi:hypothetical protein